MAKKEQKEAKIKINYEELIFDNLDGFQFTLDKTGFQFTKLNLSKKELDIIPNLIVNYKHILRLDLTRNNIQDFSCLGPMPYLITLNLDQNIVKDLKPMLNEESFPNLQTLTLASNNVTELIAIKGAPKLIRLNLNDNKIEKLDTFEGHQRLKILELKRNKIAGMSNITNMPNLRELYLSENRLKQFVGLEGLSSLLTLNLRKNNIEVFEENLPPLDNLQYLNLRENKIDKFEEVHKLAALPSLKVLIVSFNPIIHKNQLKYLYEIINMLPRLTRLNKVHITKGIQQTVIDFAEERYKKELEEKARLEREAEEKARKEAEAEEAQ